MPKSKHDALENFEKALQNLVNASKMTISEPIHVAGIIKFFELSYESGWKALKSFLLSEGIQSSGPKSVFSEAYSLKYIDNETLWLKMLDDRNFSVHVYDQEDAEALIKRILNTYLPLLVKLCQYLKTK